MGQFVAPRELDPGGEPQGAPYKADRCRPLREGAAPPAPAGRLIVQWLLGETLRGVGMTERQHDLKERA